MAIDEMALERAACEIFHAKPRNRIWDALPNEFKNQYRKQARSAITAYEAAKTVAPVSTSGEMVERLQHACRHSEPEWGEPTHALMREAATLIASQAEEIERLNEQLEYWPETSGSWQQRATAAEALVVGLRARNDRMADSVGRLSTQLDTAEAALAAIQAKHAEWRKCMPNDWEGDPLSDAIESAKASGEALLSPDGG